MRLKLKKRVTGGYRNPSQIARVMTEQWVDESIFCPSCGNLNLNKYPNNQPVADFYCRDCSESYELKSTKRKIGKKVTDGSYRTKIERLRSGDHPNLFVLNYDTHKHLVLNFFVVPKYFFVPETVEKRNPLSGDARRPGWVGSNILLERIPQAGKIFLVENQGVTPRNEVLAAWNRVLFLCEERMPTRRWVLDVMHCIDRLGKREFTLEDVYAFESELRRLHPDNRNVKAKIRQQLRLLRDKKYLDFSSRGRYRLTRLRGEKTPARRWASDITRCIDRLGKREFTLEDVYAFESELRRLHPDNRNVKAKIRQQLRLLRDKKYLDFSSRGRYRLTRLRGEKTPARRWASDITRCIDRLGKREFTLEDVYAFESELRRLHPDNRNVKAKIRQQLRLLRDKKYLSSESRGRYRLAHPFRR